MLAGARKYSGSVPGKWQKSGEKGVMPNNTDKIDKITVGSLGSFALASGGKSGYNMVTKVTNQLLLLSSV